MNIASVSLSPIVVLQQLSENQLKHQVEKKSLRDKVNAEAERKATTVEHLHPAAPQPKTPDPHYRHIDRRI